MGFTLYETYNAIQQHLLTNLFNQKQKSFWELQLLNLVGVKANFSEKNINFNIITVSVHNMVKIKLKNLQNKL